MTIDESSPAVHDSGDGNVSLEEREKRLAAALEEQAKVEKLAASRLFFVRLPRPAEPSSNDGLEKQKNAIDDKIRDVSQELQPLMAERSKVAAQLADAREAVRELKAQIDDKELILKPYQQERKAEKTNRQNQRLNLEEQRQKEKQAREEQFRAEQTTKQKIRNNFSSQYGHLGVSSDEDIDKKIRELEFSQQHESLTIAEEKAVLKQIKQLQDSREAVREYAQWVAEENAMREARKARDAERRREKEHKPAEEKEANGRVQGEGNEQDDEMIELKKVVDGLWEDYKMQMDIRKRHSEIEDGLKKQIDALLEKREEFRAERETVWEKIQKNREAARAANKPFADNRTFSSQVRELIKRGKAHEARQLCAEQTNQLMDQFASDADFRTDYNKLWDAAVDYQRPCPSASWNESYADAAKSVIAEALEAARRSVANRKSKREAEAPAPSDSVKPTTSQSKPDEAVAQDPAASAAAVAPFPVAKPAAIPGMEELADRPKPKPKREKSKKAAAVELPKVDETPFVPPPAILEKSTAEPSAEELKEQQRAHNRAAAAEAAQRKERRRLAQEKKKQQKTQQKPELQQQRDNGAACKEQAAEEVSAPETPPVEEVGFNPGSDAGAEALASAVSEDNSKLKGRNVKPSSVGTKAPKTAPPLKVRPMPRKKGVAGTLRLYSRRVYTAVEEHPIVSGVGGVAALLLAVTPAIYFYSF